MPEATPETASVRDVFALHRSVIDDVLKRYSATNPRLFGSAARGDATSSSDIDLLVDLIEDRGNPLLRIAGIGEELTDLLGIQVDVVTASLLRDEVSTTALADAVLL